MLGGSLVCAAVSTALCLGGAPATTAADAWSAQVAPSSYLVLTATSLDASGLVYRGTYLLEQAAGPAQVLRFTMTTGALAGLRLAQPCAAGAATVTTADAASLAGASVDAVSFTASIGGVPVSFSPASPPTTAFPADLQLQSVTLTAVSLSATTLSTPSFTTDAAAC